MPTKRSLWKTEGICANLTIILNYWRLRLAWKAKTFIQRTMKTNSTLTLALLLCPGLGSTESFSQHARQANLPFTLRLSHSQSQRGDSAPIRTTARRVTAELLKKHALINE